MTKTISPSSPLVCLSLFCLCTQIGHLKAFYIPKFNWTFLTSASGWVKGRSYHAYNHFFYLSVEEFHSSACLCCCFCPPSPSCNSCLSGQNPLSAWECSVSLDISISCSKCLPLLHVLSLPQHQPAQWVGRSFFPDLR